MTDKTMSNVSLVALLVLLGILCAILGSTLGLYGASPAPRQDDPIILLRYRVTTLESRVTILEGDLQRTQGKAEEERQVISRLIGRVAELEEREAKKGSVVAPGR